MPNFDFNIFLNPSARERLRGGLWLLGKGQGAVPLLHSFFTGKARTASGLPCRDLRQALICAVEVAARLGERAKPLESHLRELAGRHSDVAIRALGRLGSLEEASVAVLTDIVTGDSGGDLLMAYEAAASLLRCGLRDHPLVVQACAESSQAAGAMGVAAAYVLRPSSQKH